MPHQPPFFKKIFHNSRRALAKFWLSQQKTLQIAITGSQGKTSTTQIIAKILFSLGPTTVTDINLDTIYNVPITALKVFPWTRFAVFELGVDRPGEMDFHLQIVKPKIAIITGISPVHTDKKHLGSLANLIKEKRKLIEALPKDGFAILNWDDENVRKMAPFTKARVLWYGTDKKHCHLSADEVKISLKGTNFKLISTDFNLFQPVSTKLIGKHHIYSIMAAFLVYQLVTNSTDQIQGDKFQPILTNFNQFQRILTNIKPLSGRMSAEDGPLGTVILNDSLRANPSSTKSGLETLSEIEYENGRKIAVLAEMGELEHPQKEHKKIGQFIAGIPNITFIIFIGPLQKYAYEQAIKGGFKKENAFWVNDVFEAADVLKKIIKKGDIIYLKGSLLRHVERVVLILEGKKVGCKVIACPFYHSCLKCSHLEKGYQTL